MREFDEAMRAAAVESYLKFPQNSRKAIQHFKQLCSPPMPARPGRFIKQWGQHWNTNHDLHNTPGRGRKSRLDPAFVLAAEKVFRHGYRCQDEIRKWKNFEVAVRNDEELGILLRQSGVTSRTLFLHMLEVSLAAAAATAYSLALGYSRNKHPTLHTHHCLQLRPSLQTRRQEVRAAFPPELRADRMRIAAELLTWPLTQVLDMIFMDGAWIEILPEGGRVWVDLLAEEEKEQLIIDERLHGKHGFRLCYYAAVNARWGPCFLWLASGSTGQVSEFRVSLP